MRRAANSSIVVLATIMEACALGDENFARPSS